MIEAPILNTKRKIEIAFLETVGALHISNNPKETQDYIKASYGLVSILHNIGRSFPYADFNIFKKIGVFFIQATATKLRIWRMSISDNQIFVINCIGSVQVTTEAKNSEDLRKLINLLWLMKSLIMESYKAIDDLEDSHLSNMTKKARKSDGYDGFRDIIYI